MKKLVRLLIVLTLIILLPIGTVQAEDHRLENLYIHTYIHEDGSATITENRHAYLTEGTENYDVIENLGESKIIDFSVTEDGREYEFTEDWDINDSRENKAYRNGIIETEDGYELVWGIGDYGYHEYVLQYTVTNFIKQLEDSQVLFWRYVNDQTNIPPAQLTIVIEADKALTQEEEQIWGFGFDGDIHFEEGTVIARSNSPLSWEDYATILIRFNDGLFEAKDRLFYTFEEIKEEAFIDSDYYYDEENDYDPWENDYYEEDFNIPYDTNHNPFFNILTFFSLLPFIIIASIFILVASLGFKQSRRKSRFKGEYERDIPYDGNVIDLYRLFGDLQMTDFENLLSAILLKWIKEEYIEIEKQEVGLFFKREEAIVYISKTSAPQDPLEMELFQMFIDAAGNDYELEKAEMVRWTRRNRRTMRDWEDRVRKSSLKILIEKGIVLEKDRGFLSFIGKPYEETRESEQLEEHTLKFYQYLQDYSLLNEHDAVNVKLWDDFMIWAAFLGIADEVYKQFRQLYPEYERDSLYTYSVISLSTSLSSSVSSAKSYTDNSGSGGGGGSISGGGGGGGSFGGGSGGGTR